MIEILDMTPETVPFVAALEASCFSSPWSEKSVGSELNNPWAIWITASVDGAFAGYLGIEYGPDGADIMNIAVKPEFRRMGIADALLEEMIGRLQRLNLAWLTLEVRESNSPAIQLYRRFGFAEVGMRKNYYTQPKEHAILMTKTLRERSESNADSGN